MFILIMVLFEVIFFFNIFVVLGLIVFKVVFIILSNCLGDNLRFMVKMEFCGIVVKFLIFSLGFERSLKILLVFFLIGIFNINMFFELLKLEIV